MKSIFCIAGFNQVEEVGFPRKEIAGKKLHDSENKRSNQLKFLSELVDELSVPEFIEGANPKTSIIPINKEFFNREEPELREDLYEDTITNDFGENVPIDVQQLLNTDEAVEGYLPSEKQEISIKLLHRLIKEAKSYEDALRLFVQHKNHFFIEHYDTLTRVLSSLILSR